MNYKLIIFLVTLFGLIFFHYYNKHRIINLVKEYNIMTEKLESEKDINLNLVLENSNLGSRDRIQKLASEKLGMIYQDGNFNVHPITLNDKNDEFCLIDFIIPPAEALTE